VLRPQKERSQTSRPTRSTSHDWIIHKLDRTREKVLGGVGQYDPGRLHRANNARLAPGA
jgi:hypothetical protein